MPIPAAIGAALIGGATNVASNAIGNSGTRRSQKRADRINRNFWTLQNEYNDPSAQMARLRKAGLNPNLIYGTSPTSAVGNAGAIAPSKPADFKFENPLQGMQMFQNTKQTEAQTNNLQTQNTVLEQEAALKALQGSKIATETARSKFDLNLAKQLEKTSLDFQRESLRKLEAETIGVGLSNRFKDASMIDRVKSAFYNAEFAKENLTGQTLLNQLRSLEVELKRMGIEKSDPIYWRILGRNWNKAEQMNNPNEDYNFLKKKNK